MENFWIYTNSCVEQVLTRLMQHRLGDAIKKQLTAKGYKLEEPADFGVALAFTSANSY